MDAVDGEEEIFEFLHRQANFFNTTSGRSASRLLSAVAEESRTSSLTSLSRRPLPPIFLHNQLSHRGPFVPNQASEIKVHFGFSPTASIQVFPPLHKLRRNSIPNKFFSFSSFMIFFPPFRRQTHLFEDF